MKTTKNNITEPSAVARALNLPISSKQSFEISRHLRYKKTSFAKNFLEDVIALRKAVPFKRATRDVGHKPGMSSGRFPQKAAKEFLKLIKSAEANAQNKGLNTANLTITKLLANKASVPFQGGRHRRGSSRAHIEIMVEERKSKGAKSVVGAKGGSASKGVRSEPKNQESKNPGVKHPEVKEEVKLKEGLKEELKAKEPISSSPKESQSADILLEKARKQNSTATIKKEVNNKEVNKNNPKSERGSDANNDDAARLYQELQKRGTLRGNPSAGESK